VPMVQSDDDDRAGMRATCCAPFSKETHHVPLVEAAENPPFRGGELEDEVVREPLERPVLIDGPDVMAALSERFPEAPVRQVRIEKEPHERLLVDVDDLYEGIELEQLGKRAAVGGEAGLDLVGEPLRVDEG